MLTATASSRVLVGLDLPARIPEVDCSYSVSFAKTKGSRRPGLKEVYKTVGCL